MPYRLTHTMTPLSPRLLATFFELDKMPVETDILSASRQWYIHKISQNLGLENVWAFRMLVIFGSNLFGNDEVTALTPGPASLDDTFQAEMTRWRPRERKRSFFLTRTSWRHLKRCDLCPIQRPKAVFGIRDLNSDLYRDKQWRGYCSGVVRYYTRSGSFSAPVCHLKNWSQTGTLVDKQLMAIQIQLPLNTMQCDAYNHILDTNRLLLFKFILFVASLETSHCGRLCVCPAWNSEETSGLLSHLWTGRWWSQTFITPSISDK